MTLTEQTAVRDMTLMLYKVMPGAPRPTMYDGNYMWGDIEGNDEWCFCEQIATLIVQTSGRVFK